MNSKKSKKPEYQRETVVFDAGRVASAISYSNSAAIVGHMAEWVDKQTPGLTLRITPKKAVWYLRRRDITLRIGAAIEMEIDKARYIAEHVQLAARKGRDLRVFVKTLVALESNPARYKDGLSFEIADQFADETSLMAQRVRSGDTGLTWTWQALTNKFLDYKLPKLKLRYREKYAHYLRLEAFRAIEGKPVSDVTLTDLERLRDRILVETAPSTVHRALTQSKKMLSWAWRYHATKSGLQDVQGQWWERWSFEYSTKERTHTPTIEEIARTLVIAENFRHLAEGEHETYPGTLGALWGVALTAQRSGAFLRMRPDRVFDAQPTDAKLKGWEIANWTAEEMKGGRDGGRPHSLPFPPSAMKIIRRFHTEAGGDSPWMFPGKDPLRPITQSALNLLMHRLQGRVFDHKVNCKPDRPGKPGPKPGPTKSRPNLFEKFGIRPWTLHDARRTMTTFLDDQRLGGAASAILGHKTSSTKIDERERLAAVTELHYNRSQKIGLKADGMRLWVAALLAACAKEREMLGFPVGARRRAF